MAQKEDILIPRAIDGTDIAMAAKRKERQGDRKSSGLSRRKDDQTDVAARGPAEHLGDVDACILERS